MFSTLTKVRLMYWILPQWNILYTSLLTPDHTCHATGCDLLTASRVATSQMNPATSLSGRRRSHDQNQSQTGCFDLRS